MLKHDKLILLIYSVVHFVVDFACALLVCELAAKWSGGIDLLVTILGYNFFAFALQLPIGIIADRLNKNAICSVVGCLLVALAFGLSGINGLLACLTAGLGNALFHVGGGIDVLNISYKKATPVGIFVSTGALGIFLGKKLATEGANISALAILILILSAVALSWLYCQIRGEVENPKPIMPKLNKTAYLAIACLFLTVCLRSYAGMVMSFPWQASFLLALISVLAVVLGKALGGIVGDKIGFEKISISLIISAVGFIFASELPVVGIIAILLFNMTMPITLICLSNILKNNHGLAFGLLTLALFIGAAPALLGFRWLASGFGLCILALASAVILFLGLQFYKNAQIKIRRKK